MLQYEKIDVSEGIGTNKTGPSKECVFIVIGVLKMLNLNSNRIFVTNVTMF